jgi:murein DD-endopeptidase MepM/ murein hydrolase activator NlpD
LYDGQPSGIPSSQFQNSAYYTVTVQAKWFRDATTNESFGEASYQFHAKILAPAVFYLSNTEIDPGEFVIITGKNVEDLSQIGFTATPVIDYTPVFFKDGEYVRALIPISIALEEIPSEVSFRLSYAGREQTMQLKIKEKTFRSQTYDASATLIATTRSEAAFNEFNNTIVPILNTYTQARYFDNTKFANPSGSAQIRTGFGLYRTLTSINETYRHEGVDYVIWSKNQPALATMSGKVVYVGNLSLTGRVVVIDHGFGLHSLYAHLASTTVSVGDIVQKNDQIGVCGSTGFTTDTNLHFGLYVGEVPVSPYLVFSKGAQMTEYTESEQ